MFHVASLWYDCGTGHQPARRSQSNLYGWGRRSEPRANKLVALAGILNLSPTYRCPDWAQPHRNHQNQEIIEDLRLDIEQLEQTLKAANKLNRVKAKAKKSNNRYRLRRGSRLVSANCIIKLGETAWKSKVKSNVFGGTSVSVWQPAKNYNAAPMLSLLAAIPIKPTSDEGYTFCRSGC